MAEDERDEIAVSETNRATSSWTRLAVLACGYATSATRRTPDRGARLTLAANLP
jgi:hypothetical protein